MNEVMSSDLIRGHIDTMILRVLMESDDYGYEIIKAIASVSGGLYDLKESSLYTSLKRLEKSGLVQSYWGDESQGGRRKHYKITLSGEATYHQSVAEWRIDKDLISRVIERGMGYMGHLYYSLYVNGDRRYLWK